MKWLLAAAAAALLLAPVSGHAQLRKGPLGRVAARRAQAHSWKIAPQLPPALKLALGAVERIRYSGTRVIETKNGLNRLKHVEYVITDGPNSRIEFPADSPLHGQVIVETPNERRHYLPARNELQILPPQRDQAFSRLAKMVENRNVTVTELAGGSVAGLSTQLISIADKQGNVVQKLWIEPRSGMILKRELYDRGGTLQAYFEFTQVNLNPIIDQTEFALAPKGAQVVTPLVTLHRLMKRFAFQDVELPTNLPYQLIAARSQKIEDQQVLVQQYVGAGHRITLYQLKVPVDPKRLGNLERPDLQIYSWQAKGMSFVLVGDLSDAELGSLGRRLGG